MKKFLSFILILLCLFMFTVPASSVTYFWKIKNKTDAVVGPAVTDDVSEGYHVGSFWVDVTADLAYICVDPADGAAVWIDITGVGGGGSMSDLVDDLTPQLGGDLDLNTKGIDFPTTANVTDCLDEDNMASDSATKLATQQSIKKYVDDIVTGLTAALHIDDILTALGIASEATHFGEFTGTTITDNQTAKVVMQELETAVELCLTAEVDGSITNELNIFTTDDSEVTEGTAITIAGGGINTTSEAADTITITATEVDSVVGAVTGMVMADGAGNISAGTPGTHYLTNIHRMYDGQTRTALTNADTTPAVVEAITGVGNVYESDDNGLITDFVDADGDHSDFNNGDHFRLWMTDAGSGIKFNDNTKIEGNAGVNLTGSVSQIIALDFEYRDARWNCTNLLIGLSSPTIFGLKSISGAITIASTSTINGLVYSTVLTTCEGADDTSTGAAFLTDSGESWPTNAYVGMTLYNVTDGSSCTVTANDSTTMTGTLAGGTDNHWDSTNVWAVAPGPAQSGSCFYIGSATTILHPATAGYVANYYSTGANVIKVDPQSASMQISLNGTPTGTNGEEIDSPGAAGDEITIHNQSATVGITHGRSGTWIDGGAS